MHLPTSPQEFALNLSYSSIKLANSCARKFQLEKLLPSFREEDSLDLVAGKAFGSGLQKFLETGSFEDAVWEAYKTWTFPNGVAKQSFSILEANKKKSFMLVVMHLEKYAMTRPLEMAGWQLWHLPNGEPAVEVGFRISLPGNKYYRGFIDAIVYNPFTEEYAALEIKTSGFENASPSLFQNSFQGMSYAFMVDYITKQQNSTQIQFVAEFPKLGQQVMPFVRSPADKICWIPSLAFSIRTLEMYLENDHFPMNGESCYSYFRDCKYLGTCNLSRTDPYVQHEVEDASAFHYNFTLSEILHARKQLYE